MEGWKIGRLAKSEPRAPLHPSAHPIIHSSNLPILHPSNPPRFAAIIFDLDGVLIDSEPLHAQAWDALFADLGLARTHGMNYQNYIGIADSVFLRDFLAKHPRPEAPAELHYRKLQHLYRLIRQHRPIDRQLADFIPTLARHYPLAIASSSRQEVINVVLEVAGLTQYFKVTVGGDAVQHLKPDPEVYLTAAGRLGVPPGQCCAIEDSPPGITAAKRAGLTVIGLTTGQTAAQLHQADQLAADFTAIRKLLL